MPQPASAEHSSKKYWEIIVVSDTFGSNTIGLGILDSAFTIPNAGYIGSDANGYGYYNTNAVFNSGGQVASWGSYLSGPINISFAVDTVNNQMWARINGGLWNNDASANPATNTNGLAISLATPIYPAFVGRSADTGQLTAQFSSAWRVGLIRLLPDLRSYENPPHRTILGS